MPTTQLGISRDTPSTAGVKRCTAKQSSILRFYGYSGDVSRKQASTMIEKIKRAGWRRPDGADHLKSGSGLSPWGRPAAPPVSQRALRDIAFLRERGVDPAIIQNSSCSEVRGMVSAIRDAERAECQKQYDRHKKDQRKQNRLSRKRRRAFSAEHQG